MFRVLNDILADEYIEGYCVRNDEVMSQPLFADFVCDCDTAVGSEGTARGSYRSGECFPMLRYFLLGHYRCKISFRDE